MGLGDQPVGFIGHHLMEAMMQNQSQLQTLHPYQGPQQHIQAWRELGADNVLLQGIAKGVTSPLLGAPAPVRSRPIPDQDAVSKAVGEYLEQGVIKILPDVDRARTRYWVPIFPRPKKDSDKIRVITDLTELNSHHQVPKHRQETWKSTINVLQDTENQWGLTLDLRSWFHHLMMSPRMQRWMRFQVADQAYQIVGMPFGWSMSPWWSNKLSKPVRAWLRQQGWAHAWYIDDVMILGRTKEETEYRAMTLVEKLTTLGIQVNQEKSMQAAAQTFRYLGHDINLKDNKITPILDKTRQTLRMVKHQQTGKRTQARNLAALAGTLLDTVKSNMAISGLPQQLMSQAGHNVYKHTQAGWNCKAAWG